MVEAVIVGVHELTYERLESPAAVPGTGNENQCGHGRASLISTSQHLMPVSIDLTRRIFQRSLADLRANYRAIENMLPTIMSPTLVLWGANDPFFAASVGERVHWTIPGSRLKIYEDTGHFVPEERPSRVAQDITDFFGSIGS